jgi:hypothetical protein
MRMGQAAKPHEERRLRYAVFTFTGDALPVARRLQQEGHDVIVGMVEDVVDTLPDGDTARAEDDLTRERRLSLYDGLLEKKSAWDFVREFAGSRAGKPNVCRISSFSQKTTCAI